MKLLLDYIRSWFVTKPVTDSDKEEENFYLIN
jgi:hypothetical protein